MLNVCTCLYLYLLNVYLPATVTSEFPQCGMNKSLKSIVGGSRTRGLWSWSPRGKLLQILKFNISIWSGAPPGILGPMKRNLIGPLYRPAKKCDAVLYKIMHFNDIFYYHSHICEKNNMTVTSVTLSPQLYTHRWWLWIWGE